jgi:2,3-bisphosphoglycerate-independent phosphoglycerate mutase
MRTVVVVAAGAADRPLEELGGRTPLEAAATPVLDALAREGRMGRLAPVPEGLRPEEGAFALALFGLDPVAYPDLGGVLEAAAFDVPVGSLDQAFRLALVTADAETVFDPTAGLISRDEATVLLRALTEALGDEDLAFLPGDGWRNVLLWRGARDVRVKTVPPFEVVGKALAQALPRGTGIGRLLAAIERSREVLGAHEVNELRRDLGENPATAIWPWGPGVTTPLPSFRARKGVDAAVVGVNPGVTGAAKLQEIPVIRPPGATGRPDSNLRAKAEAALDALERHELVLLHVDGLAAASHARDFVAKVELLERIDGYVLGPLVRALQGERRGRLVFVGGEAISCARGAFLNDPVPFVMHGQGLRGHGRAGFTEDGARNAGFEVDRAHELLDFLLHEADRADG